VDGKILLALLAATGGEVAGLAFWFKWWQQEHYLIGFLALVAGEAIEFSLLGFFIVSSSAASGRPSGQVGSTLLKIGAIIFSESLLWILWIAAIDRVGLAVATGLLLVLMHLKHTAAVSVFHGRDILADLFDAEGMIATALEVGGAAIFYTLATSGQMAWGVAALAACILIEHSLQFRAAGVFDRREGTVPFVS
jgi:hypothetical protein